MKVGDKVIYCKHMHNIIVPIEIDTIAKVSGDKYVKTSRGWYERSRNHEDRADGSDRYKPHGDGLLVAYNDALWLEKVDREATCARKEAEHAARILRAAEYLPKLQKIEFMTGRLSRMNGLSIRQCDAINTALNALSGLFS